MASNQLDVLALDHLMVISCPKARGESAIWPIPRGARRVASPFLYKGRSAARGAAIQSIRSNRSFRLARCGLSDDDLLNFRSDPGRHANHGGSGRSRELAALPGVAILL